MVVVSSFVSFVFPLNWRHNVRERRAEQRKYWELFKRKPFVSFHIRQTIRWAIHSFTIIVVAFSFRWNFSLSHVLFLFFSFNFRNVSITEAVFLFFFLCALRSSKFVASVVHSSIPMIFFFPTFLPTHKVFRSFSYSLHLFLSLFLSLCVLMLYTRTLVVVQCLGGCDSLTSILFTRLVELRLWSEKTFSPTSSYKQKPREKRKKLLPTSFYCFLLSFRWKTEKIEKFLSHPFSCNIVSLVLFSFASVLSSSNRTAFFAIIVDAIEIVSFMFQLLNMINGNNVLLKKAKNPSNEFIEAIWLYWGVSSFSHCVSFLSTLTKVDLQHKYYFSILNSLDSVLFFHTHTHAPTVTRESFCLLHSLWGDKRLNSFQSDYKGQCKNAFAISVFGLRWFKCGRLDCQQHCRHQFFYDFAIFKWHLNGSRRQDERRRLFAHRVKTRIEKLNGIKAICRHAKCKMSDVCLDELKAQGREWIKI